MTRGGEDMEVVEEEVEGMGVEVEELTIALTEDPEVLVVVVVEDLLQMEAEMETRYYGLSYFYLFNGRQSFGILKSNSNDLFCEALLTLLLAPV